VAYEFKIEANSKGEPREDMEVYYKDFISKEASLDKLVDDLLLIVQGADELVEAAGVHLPTERTQELRTRLERLKDGCLVIKKQALATALATDKVLRQYPYSAMGFAFSIGLLTSVLIKRRK
jgi:ElaB/YqjD/DUF883 family membrane-anchored ribosome-binding protein